MNHDRPSGPRRPPPREPSPVIRRDPTYRGPAPGQPGSPPRRSVSPSFRASSPPPRRAWRGPPRPPPRSTPARPHRKRRWARLGAASLLVGLLLVATGIASGGIWIDTSLHRSPVFADYPERPVSGKGTTWLLVGSDSRQGLTVEQQTELTTGGDIGNGRTDTILLVHLPEIESNNPTTMVSIPRDSYVPVPGYGGDKINAAFAMGGAPLLARTVEQATGLRLDHYIQIGFGGLATLVDALGGVTMCPDEPMSDPLAGIDLPVGCQKLNGRSALGYVRTRATPRADLDRMVHQRLFVSALVRRATSPAVWLNPWRWYAVPHAAADVFTVDQDGRVWDLARLAWALHGSTTAVTVPVGGLTDSDSGSVVVWNHDAARQLFEALASDAPLPQVVLDGQA